MKKIINKSLKVFLASLMMLSAFAFIPGPSSSMLSQFAPLMAESTGVEHRVIGNPLNVRSGPGTNHSVLMTIPRGAIVRVQATNGNWARISSNHWVHRNYITQVSNASGTRIVTVNPGSSLNVRSAPTTNAGVVGTLNNGSRVSVTLRSANGWYQIGTNRWVSAQFVRRP